MAFDAGTLVGKLILDDSKWKAAIEKAKADTKSFEGAILRSSQGLTRMGIAFGVVGAAVTAVSAKMVNMAAEAIESENLFDVSMGRMADKARAWSNAMSQSLGLNQYEVRKTVGTMNVMLKSMGANEEQAYGMSTSMVKLANDMASFYNLSVNDAFEKIRSGLVGMSRPLQELGILVNDTTIKNWALTHGIIKQGQELNETQKVFARYAVILEATKAAQGDLARTIDSPMNQMRLFGASVQELSVNMGQGLIPAVNASLHVMNPMLDSLKRVTNAFPQATAWAVTFAASLGIVATVGGALMLALPRLAAAAAAAGTTIGAAAAAVSLTFLGWAAAITAVVWALQNFDFLKAIFYTFAEAVNSAISYAVRALSDFLNWLSKISPIAKNALRDARDSMAQIAHGFEENAEIMRDASYRSLQDQERKNAETTSSLTVDVKGLGDEYKNMWDGAALAAQNAGDKMVSDSDNWLKKMVSSFNVAEEMGKRTFTAMADTISGTLYDAVTCTFTSLADAARSFGNAILKILLDIFAQWLTIKIMMGLGSIFTGAAGAASGASSVGSASAVTSDINMSAGFQAAMPSFDVGSEYVPSDTIARVHKGETILQPGESKGRTIKLTIHNAITPEAIASGMQSREGVDTIINVVNSDSLRNGVTRREVKSR